MAGELERCRACPLARKRRPPVVIENQRTQRDSGRAVGLSRGALPAATSGLEGRPGSGLHRDQASEHQRWRAAINIPGPAAGAAGLSRDPESVQSRLF